MRTSLPLSGALVAILATASPAADPPKPIAATGLLRAGSGASALRVDLTNAKELHLVVTDGGDNFTADWADWVEPTLIKKDGTRLKLTDLKWEQASSGWGKVGVNVNANGGPLKVNGESVTNGIGTHAPSLISFQLPEGVVGFETKAGIDNGGSDQGPTSSVVFQVFTQKPQGDFTAASPGRGNGGPSKPVPYGYEEAKAALDSMKVPEGLSVGLFAAEPKILNPTNIDIDPRGRVWATEAVNYRTTIQKWGMLRPDGDRVVVLEDTDHDGVADKETTFWQTPELKAPLGICVLPQAHGTKVIVSAAPNVWLLTDADGDDHAEKAEKLFTVGGSWDHDHQVHAFSFGMDGKFYFNFGNEGRKLMDPEGKVIVDMAGNQVTAEGKPYRQGMVFRCDIDLEKGVAKNVETLAWDFRNNYEVAVDSFGTLWQSDNDDDGNRGVRINYVMQGGNYGYADEMTGSSWQTPRTNMEPEIPRRHWHQNDPGVVPNLLQTGGGSPTGILVNEGKLLGKTFENQMIHCDAGPRVVRAYPVTNDGAGYKAEIVDLLTSSDQWYRPADVCIAPDGSLFVADWYDAVVGGHNMMDRDAATIRGRLYRIAPKEAKYSFPAVNLTTPEGAAAALQSPNRSTQYVAWTALHQFGAAAEPALQSLVKNANPRLRARALGLLAQSPTAAPKALISAFSDGDADVRIAAIRLSTTLARSGLLDTSSIEETPGLVRRMVQDTNPQIRREIALSLHGGKKIAPLWAALAQQYDGKDRWYLEALGIGAAGNDAECLAAWLDAVGGENGQWNTPAGRDIVWRLRAPQCAKLLATILSAPGLASAEAPKFLRAYDFLPASGEKTKALLQLTSLAEKNKLVATEALQRLKGEDLSTNAELRAEVENLVKLARGTPQFVELVRDFRLRGQADGLLEIATARPDSAEGVDAAKLLLTNYSGELQPTMSRPEAAVTLLRAFGNTADPRALPILANVLQDAKADPTVRKQAVKSLTRFPAGIEAMLKLQGESKFPEDLRGTASMALAAVQLPKYKEAIAQAFPPPNAMGGKPLPPITELVKAPANAENGKALFAREQTSCITCHRVGQLGVDFGPALSEIGSKLGKEALLEAIIDPNAGISMGFETTQLTLKDGGAAVGIVRSETPDELVLALPGGVPLRHKKAEIAKREKLPNSMMPSGLNQALSQQDLVDLVAYLSTLKAPPAK